MIRRQLALNHKTHTNKCRTYLFSTSCCCTWSKYRHRYILFAKLCFIQTSDACCQVTIDKPQTSYIYICIPIDKQHSIGRPLTISHRVDHIQTYSILSVRVKATINVFRLSECKNRQVESGDFSYLFYYKTTIFRPEINENYLNISQITVVCQAWSVYRKCEYYFSALL